MTRTRGYNAGMERGLSFCVFDVPFGSALAVTDDDGLQRLSHHPTASEALASRANRAPMAIENEKHPILRQARRQLDEYYAKSRTEFDIPLALSGPEFHRAVWQTLQAIRYGETKTYGEIAAELGRPDAARAVGQANHSNPIGVIIPCHRVIGADGSLTGYAGGLQIKRFLLELEGALPSVQAALFD